MKTSEWTRVLRLGRSELFDGSGRSQMAGHIYICAIGGVIFPCRSLAHRWCASGHALRPLSTRSGLGGSGFDLNNFRVRRRVLEGVG
jgi:hypothetical protein